MEDLVEIEDLQVMAVDLVVAHYTVLQLMGFTMQVIIQRITTSQL